jgi:galactokinase
VSETVVARAPGRVNLIGEHTDYTGGLALPMAIDLEVRIRLTFLDGCGESDLFTLTSEQEEGTASFAVADASLAPGWLRELEPSWARLAAAVLAVLGARRAAQGEVTSTLPVGAGLSSSAAFEVGLALALGTGRDRLEVARLCREAEQAATGVPCGLMDQLTCVAGVEGAALLVDFASESFEAVPVPEQMEMMVVDSGQRRKLVSSAYSERHAALELAQRQVGDLRRLSVSDLASIRDPVVRRRARHVVTENARVLDAAEALRRGDAAALGGVLSEGHRSFASDFEASTPLVDEVVQRLSAQPGVYGARLTGGGFGGCVVAVAEPGTFARCEQRGIFPARAWRVTPSRGASVNQA